MYRRAGTFLRQTGEKERHARDVSIVLAGLVGAAVHDVVDGAPVHARVALDKRLDWHRTEIVGAHRRKAAAVTAERRAHGVANEGFRHVLSVMSLRARR